MSDEKTGRRTNIEDLPRAEEELNADEAKDVKGGGFTGGVRVGVADVSGDNVVPTPGDISGPHVKK